MIDGASTDTRLRVRRARDQSNAREHIGAHPGIQYVQVGNGSDMEFVQNGNQIDCVRTSRNRRKDDVSRVVVASFDAHLETIAPHVKGLLKRAEIKQLENWLEDRRKLKAKPAAETILETLPGLLMQAREAVDQLPVIDERLFAELQLATEVFQSALDAKRGHTSPSKKAELEEMGHSEALKQRIDRIKKVL